MAAELNAGELKCVIDKMTDIYPLSHYNTPYAE